MKGWKRTRRLMRSLFAGAVFWGFFDDGGLGTSGGTSDSEAVEFWGRGIHGIFGQYPG